MKRLTTHAFFLLFLAAAVPAAGWDHLEGCRLNTDAYADGDSFHVKHKGKDYIFRLYFVDAPETDTSLNNRINEQSAFWNVRTSDILKYGEEAARFMHKHLSGNRFDVHTKWSNARGSSRQDRYYAFVTVDGKDLGEMLVEEGLARVYGQRVRHPSGLSSSRQLEKLDALERDARANRRGAWGGKMKKKKPVVPEDPMDRALRGKVLTARRTLSVYSQRDPTRHVAFIRQGETFSVLGEAGNGMMRIRFKANDTKKVYEALCREEDL